MGGPLWGEEASGSGSQEDIALSALSSHLFLAAAHLNLLPVLSSFPWLVNSSFGFSINVPSSRKSFLAP